MLFKDDIYEFEILFYLLQLGIKVETLDFACIILAFLDIYTRMTQIQMILSYIMQ